MNIEKENHILVTGGSGYIGAHTIVCLIEQGYDVTVVDYLSNSSPISLERVIEITGCAPERIRFFQVDLCDYAALENVFRSSPKFQACIHFAGLKAVGESVRKPLLYYSNNLDSTINLLNLMDKYGCRSIVFSSSATVSFIYILSTSISEHIVNHLTRCMEQLLYLFEKIHPLVLVLPMLMDEQNI
jgi:UDP-glucose 4-epimerase